MSGSPSWYRLGVVVTPAPSSATRIAAASPDTVNRQSPGGRAPVNRSEPPLRMVTVSPRAVTVNASAAASREVGPMVERTTPSGVVAAARAVRQLKCASSVAGSYAVGISIVGAGTRGSIGQRTSGVLTATGAKGSRSAPITATTPAATATAHANEARRRGGLGGASSALPAPRDRTSVVTKPPAPQVVSRRGHASRTTRRGRRPGPERVVHGSRPRHRYPDFHRSIE